MKIENETIKTLLSSIKYNGEYNNIYNIIDWLRETYHLYIWVERDSRWNGYRYVYVFDKPFERTTSAVKPNYHQALIEGIEEGVNRLSYYIINSHYKIYGYKQIFDEL